MCLDNIKRWMAIPYCSVDPLVGLVTSTLYNCVAFYSLRSQDEHKQGWSLASYTSLVQIMTPWSSSIMSVWLNCMCLTDMLVNIILIID